MQTVSIGQSVEKENEGLRQQEWWYWVGAVLYRTVPYRTVL